MVMYPIPFFRLERILRSLVKLLRARLSIKVLKKQKPQRFCHDAKEDHVSKWQRIWTMLFRKILQQIAMLNSKRFVEIHDKSMGYNLRLID